MVIALKTSTATAITYTNCCGAFFIMRVTAIESIKDGVCRSYGEGEYIGDKEPNGGWMKDTGIKNPCIKLDNGKYVWGYQCWWGATEKFNDRYKDSVKETLIVDVPENIEPKP